MTAYINGPAVVRGNGNGVIVADLNDGERIELSQALQNTIGQPLHVYARSRQAGESPIIESESLDELRCLDGSVIVSYPPDSPVDWAEESRRKDGLTAAAIVHQGPIGPGEIRVEISPSKWTVGPSNTLKREGDDQ